MTFKEQLAWILITKGGGRMTFKEQLAWIEKQISKLQNEIKYNPTEELKDDLKSLQAIKYGYQQAHDKRTKLSWIESPDRMGQ